LDRHPRRADQRALVAALLVGLERGLPPARAPAPAAPEPGLALILLAEMLAAEIAEM